MAMLLVGHVTKDGAVAGPRVLEHLVDCVLQFEGERYHAHRVLRASKNRFGSTNELGVFEMTGTGLVGVPNPSELFGRTVEGEAGSAVACALEGSRPLLLEVQALVAPTDLAMPRRVGTGVDPKRLAMIVAVLTRHARVALAQADVFVNVAGGLRIDEPGADLAVALAIASAARGAPVGSATAAFGEIGLTGGCVRPPRRGAGSRSARSWGSGPCSLRRIRRTQKGCELSSPTPPSSPGGGAGGTPARGGIARSKQGFLANPRTNSLETCAFCYTWQSHAGGSVTRRRFGEESRKREVRGLYKVGDKVVYPHHGAGTVVKKEAREVLGEKREYLTIQILHNDMTVNVPCENAEKVGLRKVIDEKTVEKVLQSLTGDGTTMPKNWNRRFKHNRDKMKTGDIFELAEVVRNLSLRDHEKGLSTGEKQMFVKAKKILVSELMYAKGMDEEETAVWLDDVLAEVEPATGSGSKKKTAVGVS